METEAILTICNLVLWAITLGWVIHLKRTALRQESAELGAAGHFRPALYLTGLVLVLAGWLLVVQGRPAPSAALVLLAVTLAAQVLGLVVVDRWHRVEEKHPRSRVEMYSDLSGCLLLLGVGGLTALAVIPVGIVVVQLFLAGP